MTMPPVYERLNDILRAQSANTPGHTDPADAVVTSILDVAREIEKTHPEYGDAYQALAEALGYL